MHTVQISTIQNLSDFDNSRSIKVKFDGTAWTIGFTISVYLSYVT